MHGPLIASETPWRNPRALKNKIKHYWACLFLRSLWASTKPVIPRMQKKALKNTVRFGEFRKPASQRHSNKPSYRKYSWWIWRVFFSLSENAVGAEGRKQYWMNYMTGKQEYSKCWMFPADVSAILQNSLIPITAWVLDETNQCEIFLPRFFQLKLRVKEHWLSLSSGKYSDLWSKASNYCILSQKPHISVHLPMGLSYS